MKLLLDFTPGPDGKPAEMTFEDGDPEAWVFLLDRLNPKWREKQVYRLKGVKK